MSWFDHDADRRSRPLALAAMIALAGTAVAGCGGDDDDGSAAVDTTEESAETQTETTDTEAAQEDVTIDIVSIDEAFDPSTATVAVGSEVTWVNTDDIAHTSTAEDGAWDSGNLDPGAEFTFTADEAGTYPYICSIHPGMTGELVVE